MHPKKYLTIFGELDLKRYHYRPKDKSPEYNGSTNICPVDIYANLSIDKYSYTIQEIAVLATNEEAYANGSEIIKKTLNISLPVDSLERINKNSSKGFDDFYKDYQIEEVKEEIIVVSFDGKGVPMTKKESKNIIPKNKKGEKKQKKKEALVGVAYPTKPIKRTPSALASSLIYGKIDIKIDKNKKINKEEFEEIENFKKNDIRKIASLEKNKDKVVIEIKNYIDKMSKDEEQKQELVIVMDGARGLWNCTDRAFGAKNYTGVLDIIHVQDYIYIAGHVLFKEGTTELRDYVYDTMLEILEGKTKIVIDKLKKRYDKEKDKSKKARLKKVVTYFSNHLEYMKYDEYLEKGYPIASGVVESTCTQLVKNRTELPGARWTIKGAEAVLKHRSIKTSKDWDKYWSYFRQWNKKINYANNINIAENLLKNSQLQA